MANGLYTNTELVDTIINDINTMQKELYGGQYINACATVATIVQKLLNLRKGMQNDLDAKDEKIEILKQHIKTLGGDVSDNLPVDIMDNQNGGD